jgi:hypothetical protein
LLRVCQTLDRRLAFRFETRVRFESKRPSSGRLAPIPTSIIEAQSSMHSGIKLAAIS